MEDVTDANMDIYVNHRAKMRYNQAMADALSLSQTFLNEAGEIAACGAPSAPLEAALIEAHAAGRTRFPDIDVPAEDYVRSLARRLSRSDRPGKIGLRADLPQLVLSLHGEDLYLACACEKGMVPALLAFEEHVLRRVPAFLARLDRPPAFTADVQQILREKLFVGPDPKIAAYAGTGDLGSWVRVLCVRTALNLLRDRNELQGPSGGDLIDKLPSPQGVDPELEYMRAHYRDAFDQALRDAFAALSTEQRELLHLYYVGGLTTPKLAVLFHVNHATIVRRMQATSRRILAETRRLLLFRLQLSPGTLDSLIQALRSQLHLSMSRLLQKTEGR